MARTPTWADIDKFCRVEGWEPVSSAKGKAGRYHVTYKLRLLDGRVLRVRVSRPVNKTDVGARLWVHIRRDQLAVSDEEFWACGTNA